MSSGVFIDKEFTNRIQLSRLDQDILKFHCFGCYPPYLGGWEMSGWGCGWVGQPPHMCTHACMHTCVRTHMYAYRHDNFMQMAAPIGISHLEFPMMSYVCVRACMCMCVGVAHTHPHPHQPTHPPTPQETPPNQ